MKPGKFVLIELETEKKNLKYYVAEILEKVGNDEWNVKYLRVTIRGQFYYPNVDEISTIGLGSIKKIVTPVRRGTARQQRFISFSTDLPPMTN